MRLLLLFFLFSISVNFLTLAVADELWQNEQDDLPLLSSPDLSQSSSALADVASDNAAQRFRRRRFRKRKRQRQQQRNRYVDDDDDYYYEYDRDDSYGAPKAPASNYEAPAPSYQAPAPSYKAPSPSYAAPAPSYSAPSPSYDAPAPSYQAPAPSYGAPSDGYGAPSYSGGSGYGGGGYGGRVILARSDALVAEPGFHDYDYHDPYKRPQDDSSFNDYLNALAAFLPIGLFLAAIPPNLITINTSNTGRRRKRADDIQEELESIDDAKYFYPFLEEIAQLGYERMERSECQQMIFCRMASFGGFNENANSVQRALHYLTAMTPKFLANWAGLSDTFEASLQGDCDKFKCSSDDPVNQV